MSTIQAETKKEWQDRLRGYHESGKVFCEFRINRMIDSRPLDRDEGTPIEWAKELAAEWGL